MNCQARLTVRWTSTMDFLKFACAWTGCHRSSRKQDHACWRRRTIRQQCIVQVSKACQWGTLFRIFPEKSEQVFMFKLFVLMEVFCYDCQIGLLLKFACITTPAGLLRRWPNVGSKGFHSYGAFPDCSSSCRWACLCFWGSGSVHRCCHQTVPLIGPERSVSGCGPPTHIHLPQESSIQRLRSDHSIPSLGSRSQAWRGHCNLGQLVTCSLWP